MSQFQSLLFNNNATFDRTPNNNDDAFSLKSFQPDDNASNHVIHRHNEPEDVYPTVSYANDVNIRPTSRSRPQSKYELTASIHDHLTSEENVLVDLNALPGIKEGDFAMLYKKSTNEDDFAVKNKGKGKPRQPKLRRRFIFQIKKMNQQQLRKLNNKFQLSIVNNSLPLYLNINKNNQVYIKPIPADSFQIDLIEIFIKDIYLSRGDMWVLSNYIVNNYSSCYVQQNLTIFNSINLTISKLYINNSNVFSGIINKKSTKIIFRSKSSKLTFLIQLSSDMFHFDVTGGILYNKIINSLFPAIFQNWLDMGTNHLITVILFTSVVDSSDEQLSNCKNGETFKNAKDYYRIVVDQININHWSKIMINLRYEILKFKEDIQLIDTLLLPAIKGNLLQALNLSTVLMLNNVNNLTSLRHTQNHFILISPGSGLFDIDFNVFDKIVKKILKLDISIDLICLGAKPIHHAPMFRYRNLNNKLVYRFPTWFNCYFWIHNKFVNSFNSSVNLSHFQDRNLHEQNQNQNRGRFPNDDEDLSVNDAFELKCKIYELQMMGVMEYEMSGLQVPYLPKDFAGKRHFKTVKEYADAYDSWAFKSSYIDVDEDRIDQWISKLFEKKEQFKLNFTGTLDGAKKLSDVKVNESKKLIENTDTEPKKKHHHQLEHAQRRTADRKDKNSSTSKSATKANKENGNKKVAEMPSKSLLSKQSLVFVTNPDKNQQNLLSIDLLGGSNKDGRINNLRSAAQSMVLTDDITGVTKKVSASAYSTLKENQKAFEPGAVKDDVSSVSSNMSSDIQNKLSTPKYKSYDDLTLRSKKTNLSSYSDLRLNDPKDLTQRQLTFRSISERIFNALGGLDSSYDTSSSNTDKKKSPKMFKDNQSVSSWQSSRRDISKLQHQPFKKQPWELKRGLTVPDNRFSQESSSIKADRRSHVSSKKTRDAKQTSLMTRFDLKNTKDKLAINARKSPNVSSLNMTKLLSLSNKPQADDLEYLGIHFENPFRLFEANLDFSTVNFGKWANTYPTNAVMKTELQSSGGVENILSNLTRKGSITFDLKPLKNNRKTKNLISWRSLICPASLPTTSNEFPKLHKLKLEYNINNYEIFPNSQFKDIIDAKDLFKEMIYVRLMMGFQICNGTNNKFVKKFEIAENGIFQNNIDIINYYMPKNFDNKEEQGSSFHPIVYLTIMGELHRIFLDFYGNIRVRIYKKNDLQLNYSTAIDTPIRNDKTNETHYVNEIAKEDNYKPYVRTRYDTSYRQVEINSLSFAAVNFNWNKIDYYLAGNFDEKHSDFMYDENDRINVFQIRLVILKDIKRSNTDGNRGADNTDGHQKDNHSLLSRHTDNANYPTHFDNLIRLLKFIQRDEYKGLDPDFANDIGQENGNAVHPLNSNPQERMRTMLIDIDPAKKSHKPELLKIFYDDLSHNCYSKTGFSFEKNCYHIKLQWLTTTPKLIDDLITKWSHSCERYSLKLVEVPTYEAYKTPQINPFHSYINIKLCWSPWDRLEQYFQVDSQQPINKYYYHNYMLQASDFLLDDGNELYFNDSYAMSDSSHLSGNEDENINIINGAYVNRTVSDQELKYVQYIHKSGVYIAELKDNGEFFLAPNNIYIARVNLRKQGLRKKQKADSNDVKAGGGGGAGAGASGTGGNNTKSFDFTFSGINAFKDGPYNNERDYLVDYTSYQTSNETDEDDYFFDSQSIMIRFLEKCNNPDYLTRLFEEAKEDWINRQEKRDKIDIDARTSLFENNLQEINAKYNNSLHSDAASLKSKNTQN